MIQSKNYLVIKDLKKTIKFSSTSLKSLEKKGFITIKKIKIDRNYVNDTEINSSNSLTKLQNDVLSNLNNQLNKKRHNSSPWSNFIWKN